MKIVYSVEAGTIENGREYPDDWIESTEDFESAAEAYIDIDLAYKRTILENEGTLISDEILYKRLTADRENDDRRIEDSVTIAFESEDTQYEPPLTDVYDFDRVVADYGFPDVETLVDTIR